MKKRNIAVVVILHIFTFGIYFLYWAYATRKELVAENGDPKSIPTFKWLLSPLLFLLPLPFMFAALPPNETHAPDVLLLLGILADIFALAIVSLAVFLWWFYHYCKAASAMTKGLDFSASYVLFVIAALLGVTIVWHAIIQNDLNRLAGRLADKSTPQPKPAS